MQLLFSLLPSSQEIIRNKSREFKEENDRQALLKIAVQIHLVTVSVACVLHSFTFANSPFLSNYIFCKHVKSYIVK